MADKSIIIDPADVLTVTVSATTTEPPVEPPPVTGTPHALGLNLGAPWESEVGARTKLFNDLALTGRFIYGDPATGPSKFLFLTVSNGACGAKVRGIYTLKATTNGSVTGTAGPVTKLSADTWEVNVQGDTDASISFTAPVTIHHIWRPGANEAKTCSNEFLTFVKPFAFIRFMDLMMTNWSSAADAAARMSTLGPDGLMSWSERPSDTEQFNRPWGISVEAAIRICNETKKDMWLNMTHVANDQYYTALLSELRAKLDPSLNVYFAYSNEIWNHAGGFYQSGLIDQIALDYVAAGTQPRIDTPTDNKWYYAARYQLKRLHDLWVIANPVLGARCRIIFESQFASGYYGNALMWSKRTYGNNDWVYGLACAPYIWGRDGSPQEIIATLDRDYKTRMVPDSKLAKMRALCDGHLKNNNLYFYEVGIDMGQGETNLDNRMAASYDPAIKGVVAAFLQTNFADKGVAGAAWFNGCGTHDKWGAWGATDDASDLTQPMYEAIAEFAQRPALGAGVKVEFFGKTDFTNLLETKRTPVIDHSWVSWTNGPLHHGQNPTWTEGKDGAIRFTGKYKVPQGVTGLFAAKEANDDANLAVTGAFTAGSVVDFTLDYVGRFGGNGSCFVQLQEVLADGTKRMVPAERYV